MPRTKESVKIQLESKKIGKPKKSQDDQSEKEMKKASKRKTKIVDEDDDDDAFSNAGSTSSEGITSKNKMKKRSSAGQKHIPQLNTLFVKFLLLRLLHEEKFNSLDFSGLKDHNINNLVKRVEEAGLETKQIHLDYIKKYLITSHANENCPITKIEKFYECYKIKVDDNKEDCQAKHYLSDQFINFMNSKFYTLFICFIYRGNLQSRLWLIRNKYPILSKFFKEKTMPFYTVEIPDMTPEVFLEKVKERIIEIYDNYEDYTDPCENEEMSTYESSTCFSD